jgi:hypothetical protein
LNISTEIAFNGISDYSRIWIEFIKYNLFNLPVKFRAYGGYSSSLPPVQNQFNLTSASPSEQYSNSFYRGLLGFNRKFPESVKLGLEGGGGLKGYIDRFNDYNGKNLISVNLETNYLYPFRTFDLNIPLISDIKAAFFLDAGNIWNEFYDNANSFFKKSLIDGGILFELSPFDNTRNVNSVYPFLNNFIIRFNIPFLLSYPDPGKKKFDFNWNISIGRAISL